MHAPLKKKIILILSRHEIGLAIAVFAFFAAWSLSVLFGDYRFYIVIQSYDFSPPLILYIYLFTFGGLLASGFFIHDIEEARRLILVSLILCIFSTFLLPLSGIPLTPYFKIFLVFISSFAVGMALAAWGLFIYASLFKGSMTKTIFLALFIARCLSFLLDWLSSWAPIQTRLLFPLIFLLLALMLHILSFIIPFRPTIPKATAFHPSGIFSKPFLSLYTINFIVSINAGLVFEIVQPVTDHVFNSHTIYRTLPYILTLPVAKFLLRKVHPIFMMYAASLMISLAALIFAYGKHPLQNDTLIWALTQSSGATYDFLCWCLLGQMMYHRKNPVGVFGIGLTSSLLGIFSGRILGSLMINVWHFNHMDVSIFVIITVLITLSLLPLLHKQVEWLLSKTKADSSNPAWFFRIRHQKGGYGADETPLIHHQGDSVSDSLPHILSPSKPLTPREEEICRRLLQGETYKDIAAALYISENTIKTHTRRIYVKFNVENRKELASAILKEEPPDFSAK